MGQAYDSRFINEEENLAVKPDDNHKRPTQPPKFIGSTQQQSALTLKSAGCTRLSRRKIGGKYSGSQFHLAKTVKLL
jgi:hypothetical protein